MTLLKQAKMHSKDGLINDVQIFYEEDSKQIIIMPKISQSILLFDPNESLIVTHSQALVKRSFEVQFDDVKILSKKNYYYFTITNEETEWLLSTGDDVFLINDRHTVRGKIIDVKDSFLSVQTPFSITKREIGIIRNGKNQSVSLSTKVLWMKNNDVTRIYGFSLL